MTGEEIRVEITVKGRVGPSLRSQFPDFDQQVVARHHILVVSSGLILEALAAGAVLEEHQGGVERITG
jgi:hypothetical protein